MALFDQFLDFILNQWGPIATVVKTLIMVGAIPDKYEGILQDGKTKRIMISLNEIVTAARKLFVNDKAGRIDPVEGGGSNANDE